MHLGMQAPNTVMHSGMYGGDMCVCVCVYEDVHASDTSSMCTGMSAKCASSIPVRTVSSEVMIAERKLLLVVHSPFCEEK